MGRRHADALPAMRHHRRSGNARVRIGGIEHWLGPWGSADSRLRYDELIAAWIASGRKSVEAVKRVPCPAPAALEVELPTSGDVTVGELARAWIASIERERAGAHKRASNWNGAIAAARALRSVAAMPARDFGPRALQDVRRRLVDTPFLRKRRLPDGTETTQAIPRSRRYVNDTVGRIRQLFNWAVGLELIPPERAYALSRVRALPLGQGRETQRRTEVAVETVNATLPHLTAEVRALVQFIRWTGCRPSEAARLRMFDVHDRDRQTWRYRPPVHKTAHRGQYRDVPIGPQARAILEAHAAGRPDDEHVFDPRRSLARIAGNGDIIKMRRKPSARVGTMFTSNALRVAIQRAAVAAGVPPWTAYQLRYLRLREVRRDHGPEAARATAGHTRDTMTAHYAPPSWEAAAGAAAASG
ncbi:MAG: tyrosine-type recombinase/integrase [Planctomycetota bacterium]